MLRTLFATTALTSMLAFGAIAQQAADPAADPLVPPSADAPADATQAPETAQDPGAMTPAAPSTETAQQPDAAIPEATETAEQPDAAMPEVPAAETAEDPGAMTQEQPATETVQDQAPDAMVPGDPALTDAGPVLTPVAAAEISADTLIGATIQTPAGENIAEVDDVLLTPDGGVENLVAEFGGFLGFGSNTVLLTMDEIEVLQDEAGNFVVQTSLTPEALEGRPEYQPEN
jgi:hypothetical protein